MDNRRDELDRLIDGALASYTDAEPLAGLEARVVGRVRVARARRRWLAWGMGAAVAASVVIVVIVSRVQEHGIPKPIDMTRIIAPAPPLEAVREPAIAVKHAWTPKRERRRSSLPKLEQFPAMAASTPEERALVALVQEDPEEAQEVLAANNGPIRIQTIQIPPLLKETQ